MGDSVEQLSPTQDESNPGIVKQLDNVVGTFATDYSSAHGLPNIYKSTSVFGRLCWTILFLGAFGVCAWQFQALIIKYMAFNTATEVGVLFVWYTFKM